MVSSVVVESEIDIFEWVNMIRWGTIVTVGNALRGVWMFKTAAFFDKIQVTIDKFLLACCFSDSEPHLNYNDRIFEQFFETG